MKPAGHWFSVAALAVVFLPALAHADVGTVWVRTYAQPGYCNDEATAMFVDRAGNVYVTGSSQVTEAGQKDFATVKYNSGGVQQWAERYSGVGNSIPYSITVDGAGNVYVTGASESTGTSYDYLTLKYDAAGVLQWHDRYNGAANGDDRATSVCVDSSGNVAVCGYVAGGSTSNDWTIIGYSPEGARRFVTPRTSSGGNPDEAYGITADPQGNYYVAGRLWYEGNVDDAVVAKYNSAGAEQWTVNYDGPLSGDGAVAICRSTAGDLYATGWSTGPTDNTDVLTMKVSAAGALQWVARYTPPENGNDMGTRIVADAEGNARVLGRVQVGPGSDYDLVTLGYRADSATQFINRLNSGGYAVPGGLAVDNAGHVFVSAELAGDYLTLEYDGTIEAWRRIEDFGSGAAATAIGTDDSGYVYVSGRGEWGATAWDFTTVKYDPRAGIEESPKPQVSSSRMGPTIVRGLLTLAPASEPELRAASLLDVNGRKVMNLVPGANDVSRVAPGVHFVCDGQSQIRKILIER